MAAIVSGCAAAIDPPGYAIAGTPPAAGQTAPVTGKAASPAAASGYQLNEDEKAADCGRLTGRMKIRIMALKHGAARAKTSELSRSLQSATTTFGGSTIGVDPYGAEQRDRAMLDAYNQQLAAKGCKTLDLAAELKPDANWSADTKPELPQ